MSKHVLSLKVDRKKIWSGQVEEERYPWHHVDLHAPSAVHEQKSYWHLLVTHIPIFDGSSFGHLRLIRFLLPIWHGPHGGLSHPSRQKKNKPFLTLDVWHSHKGVWYGPGCDTFYWTLLVELYFKMSLNVFLLHHCYIVNRLPFKLHIYPTK